MSAWNNRIRSEIEFLHNYNCSAMIRAGFQPDPGRTLSPEEIQKISLTPPNEILDCGFKPEYFWR